MSFEWIQEQLFGNDEAKTEQRIRLEVELSNAKIMLEKAKKQSDTAALAMQEAIKCVTAWEAQVDNIHRAIRAVDLL